jgi:hypothetical protein
LQIEITDQLISDSSVLNTQIIYIQAGSPSEYTYTIFKYSRTPGERYEINIESKFSDDLSISYSGKVIYLMEITPLLVQILGGNRQ